VGRTQHPEANILTLCVPFIPLTVAAGFSNELYIRDLNLALLWASRIAKTTRKIYQSALRRFAVLGTRC